MPAWLLWVQLIAVLLTLFFIGSIMGQLSTLRLTIGGGAGAPRSKAELEELYKKGTIDRDTYERYQGRLK